jgi:hypothetical protein
MVAFRSSSSVSFGVPVTNTVIPAPAGIQDGDSLLIVWEGGANPVPPTPTPPSGFVVVANYPRFRVDALGFRVDTWAWEKIASGESGDYTVLHAGASTNAYMQAASGPDLVTPISPAPTVQTGLGATATAPGLTTLRDGSLIVYLCSKWAFPGITPPGGSTPALTTRLDGSTTLLFVSTGVLSPAGPTGDKVATGLPNAPDEPWFSGLIAIQPPAAPPVGASEAAFARGDGSGV